MKKKWDILHKFLVVILWLTLGFGAAGSLRGASVESKIRSDIHHTIPAENEVGTTLPYMTGWFDLSKDQNLWYSFSYALRWSVCGLVLSLLLLIVAVLVYQKKRRKK